MDLTTQLKEDTQSWKKGHDPGKVSISGADRNSISARKGVMDDGLRKKWRFRCWGPMWKKDFAIVETRIQAPGKRRSGVAAGKRKVISFRDRATEAGMTWETYLEVQTKASSRKGERNCPAALSIFP